MVNYHVAEIADGLRTAAIHRPRRVSSGHAAAVSLVNVMQGTFDLLAPRDIVNDFLARKLDGDPPRRIADGLWTTFGERTVQAMANGSACLAMLWESAWREGGGAADPDGSEAAIPERT